MGKQDKPNRRKREGLDDIDLQILAIKASCPESTIREIAKQVGRSPAAVCVRLQRIPEQKWIKDIRARLESLLPLAAENVAERLGDDDHRDRRDVAADKLLAGLGHFRSKHDLQHSGSVEVNEENVAEFLLNCDHQTYERISEKINAAKQD